MVSNRHKRVGKEFCNLLDDLREGIEQEFERKITDAELTNDLARFMRAERYDEMIKNRAKMRKKQMKRGGLFF